MSISLLSGIWHPLIWLGLLVSQSCAALKQIDQEKDAARPRFHFTPPAMWMNDPNGMIFYEGEFHLYYQHHPDSLVWGPMHWGHAVSRNLIDWEHLPIALYPDSLGYIFSGSAVVDYKNTAGFQQGDAVPLVAIFSHHNPDTKRQQQSLSYSLDKGRTWTKYSQNPVLQRPDLKDFRDPKVFWHQPDARWVMVVAAGDEVQVYTSPDLKAWEYQSSFGKEIVKKEGEFWECPDLFALNWPGEQKWILLVSVIAGAPNLGSATQYYIGSFDGKTFVADSQKTKWLDYGPDNYAGVTWSNVDDRKVYLGWMSNWAYATKVPETGWRGAMTIPRELGLVALENDLHVTSKPIGELTGKRQKTKQVQDRLIVKPSDFSKDQHFESAYFDLEISAADLAADLSISFHNQDGEEIVFGYEKSANRYFVDRSRLKKHNFSKHFPRVQYAPAKLPQSDTVMFRCLVDATSIELFAENNATILTTAFFPAQKLNKLKIRSEAPFYLKHLQVHSLGK